MINSITPTRKDVSPKTREFGELDPAKIDASQEEKLSNSEPSDLNEEAEAIAKKTLEHLDELKNIRNKEDMRNFLASPFLSERYIENAIDHVQDENEKIKLFIFQSIRKEFSTDFLLDLLLTSFALSKALSKKEVLDLLGSTFREYLAGENIDTSNAIKLLFEEILPSLIEEILPSLMRSPRSQEEQEEQEEQQKFSDMLLDLTKLMKERMREEDDNSRQSIVNTQKQCAATSQEMIKTLRERNEVMKNRSCLIKFFDSTVGKILVSAVSLICAIIFTVGTLGAGGPIAVLMIASVVYSAVDLVTTVSSAITGKDCSITKGIEMILVNCGMNEEKAKAYSGYLTMAIGFGLCIGAGLAGLGKAGVAILSKFGLLSKLGLIAKSHPSMLKTLSTGAATLSTSVLGTTKSAAQIMSGIDARDVSLLEAQAMKIEASQEKKTQEMNQFLELMRNYQNFINGNWRLLNETITTMHRTKMETI